MIHEDLLDIELRFLGYRRRNNRPILTMLLTGETCDRRLELSLLCEQKELERFLMEIGHRAPLKDVVALGIPGELTVKTYEIRSRGITGGAIKFYKDEATFSINGPSPEGFLK